MQIEMQKVRFFSLSLSVRWCEDGDADGDPEGEFFLFVCQPDDVKMEIQKVSFFSLTLSVNQMMWGRLGKFLWKMMDSAAINFSRRLINSSHTLATQKT